MIWIKSVFLQYVGVSVLICKCVFMVFVASAYMHMKVIPIDILELYASISDGNVHLYTTTFLT